jgi:serine/threonine protein kinase
MYEIITGRIPFEGKNANATLYAIIANDPPPLAMFAAGDDELWTILSIGLAKDPDKRWQTMRTLGEALARWLRSRGVNEDVSGAAIDATWRPVTDRMDSLSTVPPQVALGERRENPIATTTMIGEAMQPLSRRIGRALVWMIVIGAALSGIGWWMLSDDPPPPRLDVAEPAATERPSPAPPPAKAEPSSSLSQEQSLASAAPSVSHQPPAKSVSTEPHSTAKAAKPKKVRSRPATGSRAPSGPRTPMKDPFR